MEHCMSWAYMLLVQAPAATAEPVAAQDFDLRDMVQQDTDTRLSSHSDGCDSRDETEIVVCAQRGPKDGQRLPSLPSGFDEKPLVAETGLLGDITGKVSVETVEFPGGVESNRVMFTIKTPF
ncbi:hypothetical protein [Sphingomonas sp. LaA6.9]|uniref:hypothetical protein n=1 Tax=Sphingomonas sp. LaA6.9 TaxID=2919914 RepID=UPI001F500AA1|nr:hypothetical protein [Sphingomonas sp. LaA6.9]MCJ8155812.1 hypothetical protein [Sphingomonas sp. LaA6.9]